jgi:integrase
MHGFDSANTAADSQTWSKKTYNNAVSALRRAFAFGFKDYPEARDQRRCCAVPYRQEGSAAPPSIQCSGRADPDQRLDSGASERPCVPVFTGLRPSEQIAFIVSDYDRVNGVLSITKGRVQRELPLDSSLVDFGQDDNEPNN